jgi:hypothetical protein
VVEVELEDFREFPMTYPAPMPTISKTTAIVMASPVPIVRLRR